MSRRLVDWLDGLVSMYVCIPYLAGRRKFECVPMLAWFMTDGRMVTERLG